MRTRGVWIAAFVLAILVLAPAAAQAATNSFQGPGTDWNAGSNWSLMHVPTSSEDVSISTANPTLASGADGVANSISLASSGTLAVSGGKTLTVGSGTSTLAGGNVNVHGGTLHLGGTTTLSSGDISVDTTGDVEIDGSLSLAADQGLRAFGTFDGLVHVASGGSLQKTAGSGTSLVEMHLDNDGTVSAESGTLEISHGDAGSTTGSYVVSAGVTLKFSGDGAQNWTVPALSGAGTLLIAGGDLTMPSTSTFSVPITEVDQTAGTWTVNTAVPVSTFAGSGGERDGTGALTITHSSTLTGIVVSGSGSTTIDAAATTSTLDGGRVQSGHTLNLNHDTTLSNNNYNVETTGTVNLGAALSLAGDVGFAAFGTTNGVVNVLPGGALQKTGGTGTSTIGVQATSAGLITLSTGTLSFNALTETGGFVTVPAATTINGPITMTGGVLNGNGTFGGPVSNSGGTVAPGSSPGKLTISGDYTQAAGGTLAEEVTGTTQDSQFDHLVVGGGLTLGGTLAVNSLSFTPASSDTFKIISGASSASGQFAQLTGATVNGFTYSPQYDADGVTLVASAPAAPQNTSPPTIPGNGHPGDSVTCNPGAWTGSPTFAYSWTQDGAPIAGQVAQTYALRDADAGHQIHCVVVGHNAGGDSAPATSNALSVTATPLASVAPSNTAPPSIPSAVKAGDRLTCNPGSWSGSPSPSLSFQWLRGGIAIAGATAQTYTAVAADVGTALSCQVSGANSAGTKQARSNQAVVSPAAAAPLPRRCVGLPGGDRVCLEASGDLRHYGCTRSTSTSQAFRVFLVRKRGHGIGRAKHPVLVSVAFSLDGKPLHSGQVGFTMTLDATKLRTGNHVLKADARVRVPGKKNPLRKRIAFPFRLCG